MKKIFLILLAVTLTFSMAACGGSSDAKTPNNTQTMLLQITQKITMKTRLLLLEMPV